MKIKGWLAAGIALLLVLPMSSKADDLFQLFWRGTIYTKNSSGRIIAFSFTEQDFINKVAQDNGLDPSQLVFVYRPNKRDTVVVQSNGKFVADVIQMEYQFTDVVNPSGSAVVRHALLFDEAHGSTALGSFFGLETITRNSNGSISNDNLVGTVFYSMPDLGRVYDAHVSTGKRIVDTSGG